MDDLNRVETEEQDGQRAGALRLLRARHQSQAFRDQTRESLQSQSNTPLPPGLESDPIARQLQSMGLRVTRANWLTLDQGSSDESNLNPETAAMLDRMFPTGEET